MGEVVGFPGKTTLPDMPNKILRAAIKEKLEKCVVIGRQRDGGFWFSGNFSDAFEILWLLEMAKRELISLVEDFGSEGKE